jgi:hypothetical protein
MLLREVMVSERNTGSGTGLRRWRWRLVLGMFFKTPSKIIPRKLLLINCVLLMLRDILSGESLALATA